MEYLEGETLAQRLREGAAAGRAGAAHRREIADALGTAHSAGIVHRDLKPGNVMLTKAGAKLLDFGLAKLTDRPRPPAAPSVRRSPRRPPSVVGTLPYMAPEQVEGRKTDARTDLWALGAVLYEMLTGSAPSRAKPASLIGAILEPSRRPSPPCSRSRRRRSTAS